MDIGHALVALRQLFAINRADAEIKADEMVAKHIGATIKGEDTVAGRDETAFGHAYSTAFRACSASGRACSAARRA